MYGLLLSTVLLGFSAGAAGALSQTRLPERINPLGDPDRCTTIVVGRKASADGSTMTTHTNDCGECDFRLAKVPARDWPKGSKRPVYVFASAYPRKVESGRSRTWDPSNLEGGPAQLEHWNNSFSKVAGYIPQVEHTYALIEGTYGIMNEHQVAIGESTCPGRFQTRPVTDGGHALLEVSELTSIALERCKTARCAVETMGGLGEEYGYYGAEWAADIETVIAEAGEALTVTDLHEAWVFHILPDDTGKSAVWAAQRVPSDHMTIIANQFTIRQVKRDSSDFLYSKNLWTVAENNGLWKPEDGELDFMRVYGYRRLHAIYSTRRLWRVFTLAAPSLADILSPSPDDYANGYPFSVKPDQPLTPHDLMRFQRDHFEGTQFDLTVGVGAGPYGNPNRYDPAPRPEEGVSAAVAGAGMYERPVSMFRTAYSTVTQSRADKPDAIGARLWVCQYMPSMSVYTPVYVSAPELPEPFTVGSLFKYTRRSFFWAAAAVGNWATRFYKFIREDVEAEQARLERPLDRDSEEVEKEAARLLKEGKHEDAARVLQEFSDRTAKKTLDTWNELFEVLIAKYRDGYRVSNLKTPVLKQEFLFYPLWWLRVSGFFHNRLTMKDADPLPDGSDGADQMSQSDLKALQEAIDGPSDDRDATAHGQHKKERMGALGVSLLVASMSALSLAVGVWVGKRMTSRRDYFVINV